MSMVDEGPSDVPVYLLIHGNPCWSFLYRDLIGRLRDKCRVIAPDHIGFGLSDKPPAAYHTLERHISNLTRLIDALQLRNITLVMNGWGGPIGLGYAVAHPENIARMVLTNTWCSNLPQLRRLKLPLGMRIAARGRLGAMLDSVLNLTMHSAISSRTYRTLGDMAQEGYTYPFSAASSRTAMKAFNRMFFQPDSKTIATIDGIFARLKKIEAPVSILWGTRDPVLTKLPAYLLRDELRHASEPVFLPDVGHYPPEEAPEKLAEIVLQQPGPAHAPQGESVFRIIG
jgi:haloalkane dehalogenase